MKQLEGTNQAKHEDSCAKSPLPGHSIGRRLAASFAVFTLLASACSGSESPQESQPTTTTAGDEGDAPQTTVTAAEPADEPASPDTDTESQPEPVSDSVDDSTTDEWLLGVYVGPNAAELELIGVGSSVVDPTEQTGDIALMRHDGVEFVGSETSNRSTFGPVGQPYAQPASATPIVIGRPAAARAQVFVEAGRAERRDLGGEPYDVTETVTGAAMAVDGAAFTVAQQWMHADTDVLARVVTITPIRAEGADSVLVTVADLVPDAAPRAVDTSTDYGATPAEVQLMPFAPLLAQAELCPYVLDDDALTRSCNAATDAVTLDTSVIDIAPLAEDDEPVASPDADVLATLDTSIVADLLTMIELGPFAPLSPETDSVDEASLDELTVVPVGEPIVEQTTLAQTGDVSNDEGVGVDANGDGTIDYREFDDDGNGQVDRRDYDRNGDGTTDERDRDRNGDGAFDERSTDRNGDGGFDERRRDTNGDGRFDERERDTNGDREPDSRERDTNGDGQFDQRERDTDGDGAFDEQSTDSNHDGGFDTRERDTDGDGQFDERERDADGNREPDQTERDTNGDGQYDEIEYDRNEDGTTDERDRDTNGDGAFDERSIDRNGDGGFDERRRDTNGDGRFDERERDTNGDREPDSRERDTNGDGQYDERERDTDGNGTFDEQSTDSNHDGGFDTRERDTDGDGQFDERERDTNGDRVPDQTECDTDNDGQYDELERDTNNDGRVDETEIDTDGDGNYDRRTYDSDGDGTRDAAEVDSDGDGEYDTSEPLTPEEERDAQRDAEAEAEVETNDTPAGGGGGGGGGSGGSGSGGSGGAGNEPGTTPGDGGAGSDGEPNGDGAGSSEPDPAGDDEGRSGGGSDGDGNGGGSSGGGGDGPSDGGFPIGEFGPPQIPSFDPGDIIKRWLGEVLGDIIAFVSGDPHLQTLDGHRYDFQGTGEFVLVESDALDVQARFEGRIEGANVTWMTAAATQTAAHTVTAVSTISGDGYRSVVFELDGEALDLDHRQVLSDGTVVRADVDDPNAAVIITPDRSWVRMSSGFAAQRVELGLASDATAAGLLGVPDGDTANDFTLRDGTLLTLDEVSDRELLYGVFGESWRVAEDERLFDDGLWADFQSADNLAIPEPALQLSDLDADVVASAEEICAAAGMAPGAAFDECVFDVAITGDPAWAFDAAAVSGVAPPASATIDRVEVDGDDFELTFDGSGDEVVVAFTIEVDAVVTINVSDNSDDVDAQMSLFRGDGTGIVIGSGGNFDGAVANADISLASGTYELRANAREGSTGTVTLAITESPRDVVLTEVDADPVVVDFVRFGSSGVVEFDTDEGEVVTVQITGNTPEDLTGRVSMVSGATGALVIAGFGGFTEVSSADVWLGAGRHRIYLVPDDFAPGSVEVTVTSAPRADVRVEVGDEPVEVDVDFVGVGSTGVVRFTMEEEQRVRVEIVDNPDSLAGSIGITSEAIGLTMNGSRSDFSDVSIEGFETGAGEFSVWMVPDEFATGSITLRLSIVE